MCQQRNLVLLCTTLNDWKNGTPYLGILNKRNLKLTFAQSHGDILYVFLGKDFDKSERVVKPPAPEQRFSFHGSDSDHDQSDQGEYYDEDGEIKDGKGDELTLLMIDISGNLHTPGDLNRFWYEESGSFPFRLIRQPVTMRADTDPSYLLLRMAVVLNESTLAATQTKGSNEQKRLFVFQSLIYLGVFSVDEIEMLSAKRRQPLVFRRICN